MKHAGISWNASAELGLMDMFLSRPNPKRWILSQISRIMWKYVDWMEDVCLFFEPRKIHVNERLVEIPFVLQSLPRSGRILDVGCSSSVLALQLACMGYHVTAIDVREYIFSHPNLKFYRGDVSSVSIQEESHDCAILISTLEHMGLGHYGDAAGLSDRQFLDIVARYVKPDGAILLTVPFGQALEGDWYRVYDSEKLASLVSGYHMVEKKFARRLSLLQWQICQEKDLVGVDSEVLPVNGVALLKIKRSKGKMKSLTKFEL